MKLSALMYHDESSLKQKYKFVNNNKQPQAIKTCVNCVCAYKLLVVGPSNNET